MNSVNIVVEEIRRELFLLRDPEYAAFQSKLTPTVSPELFIGVRVPKLRGYAKNIVGTDKARQFLLSLPHKYYDENLLHGLLLSQDKDFDRTIELLEAFLPYVDNWAVCDTMSPRTFKRNREKLFPKIEEWVTSSHVYTCRFAIDMLMSHYLDEDFSEKYLAIPAEIISDEYYVNMMIAWYFATALAKQWDATIPYIEERRLPEWVHKKTIQKARESFRITPEQKEYLKSLK